MELHIQTWAGTEFGLQVAPYDTVMSVKSRIQQLEGISVSQQHLVWQSEELADECSLCDYGIRSGATLKLVLAMRGGPVSTRRVKLGDRPSNLMSPYVESGGGYSRGGRCDSETSEREESEAQQSDSSRGKSREGKGISSKQRLIHLTPSRSSPSDLKNVPPRRLVASPNQRLPPVKVKKRAKKLCSLCGRKTGLADSFLCRCGSNFCAPHRYAEAHYCPYDYKAEGRKIIEQANPAVVAPKLPKI